MYKEWLNLLKVLIKEKHQYKFNWLGVNVIQLGEDLLAYQELIWKVKPEIIIETGVKHGGSVIFSASMLALLETCGKIYYSRVIGIDIKDCKIDHPLTRKITMLKGSSTDEKILKQVREIVKDYTVMVFLDSNHSYQHVLNELNLYAPLVSVGSYIVVGDTGVEYIAPFSGYTKENNPNVAVREFLKNNDNFVIDEINSKLIMTANPNGFLRRIK